jgi:hypothetical protein
MSEYIEEDVLDDDGRIIGFNIINTITTNEVEAFLPVADYRVYSVDYMDEKPTDHHLRASYDTRELAVVAAMKIAMAEELWMRVSYGDEVVWDNGEQEDHEGVSFSLKAMVNYMVAKGLLTSSGVHMTPKGKAFAEEVEANGVFKTEEEFAAFEQRWKKGLDDSNVWDVDEEFVVLAADGDSDDDPIECSRFPDVGSAVAEADRLWQTEGKYSLVMRGRVMIWNCCDDWDC